MKPILYNYHCGNCDYAFKVPELPDAYGEFVMKSENASDSVYLNSFTDKVFDEVEELYKNNELIKKSNRLDDTALFQTIFSVSCDFASDGSQYQIARMPVCPNCGSSEMSSWGQTTPPEFLDEDIKSVQHENWNKLTNEEKKNLINDAIEVYLSKSKVN